MDISYLDYIKDFKDGVFQIDDESMINYVMNHYGFINRNSPDYLFSIRNRKYNICNDKELADEVYKDIYKFIQEIKSIDTNLPVEDYVSSLLNLGNLFTKDDVFIHTDDVINTYANYINVLTPLINRKLK